eukprot:TRINITY_DN29_c0_g1_i2.p1 TRINITY_DN29_c0_g1~~TRINITY_DN29_c0_g1_i2.p1  ORF type:complete len:843 (+),score=335.89 TRINITY_DN29_c0_g1_i2:88-2616(+)
MPSLADQVAAQGDKVRALKAAKAPLDQIKTEVAQLLALKAELAKEEGGAAPAAAPAPAAGAAKGGGGKKEQKQKGAAPPSAAPGSGPGSLAALDALLQEQPYLNGFEPTQRDAQAFEEMFQGNRAVAEWAARMARYYPAERRRLCAAAAPQGAGAAGAAAKAAKPPAPAGGEAAAPGASNFLRELIKRDLAPGGRCAGRKTPGDVIRTRFPPEPNGYLHIGHAKSICLNFGFAKEFNGRCHLRYDDTNPTSEKQEYIDQIEADVRWLGFDWGPHKYFASEYFDQLYDWAVHLIRNGDAYVDSQSGPELKKNRGDLSTPGVNSPFRDRPVEENLRLFQEMRDGKHKEGVHVLRAKIDMASGNMCLRDPLLYRVLHKSHPHTGDKWCIYPLYDYAHGQEDAIEGITHSFCTLEFDVHRPLYDWFLQHLPIDPAARPVQTEFNRLNVTNTVLSKRKLKMLVDSGVCSGWDDPRMPTICGMRRRGVTPEALRNFVEKVGVSRTNTVIDQTNMEESIRDDLDSRCPRRFAVLDPIKLIITDYPAGKEEVFRVANHPKRPEMGEREMPFTRELFIERDDYRDDPPPDFYRLKPGGSAMLRCCGFVVTVTNVVRDPKGAVTEVHCTHTTSGDPKTVKGHLHWVSAPHAVPARVRLYSNLLKLEADDAQGSEDGDAPAGEAEEGVDAKVQELLSKVNPDCLVELPGARLERSLAAARPPPLHAFGADLAAAQSHFQFERSGYFVVDTESAPGKLVLNRTITLRASGLAKQEDSEAMKRSRKDEQARQAAEKAARKHVDPKDMFRGETDKYSQFDADGVPTHDAAGAEIPKAQVKKLKKEWEKQKKIFLSK